MNPREWAQKHWEVVKAYGEGKEVQVSRYGELWQNISDPELVSTIFYRIKPEPKLVPYGPEDFSKLWGRRAKNKESGVVKIICDGKQGEVFLYGYAWVSLGSLFEHFLDVTLPGEEMPFGKEVVE